jgi:hypothetical protein
VRRLVPGKHDRARPGTSKPAPLGLVFQQIRFLTAQILHDNGSVISIVRVGQAKRKNVLWPAWRGLRDRVVANYKVFVGVQAAVVTRLST